MLLSAPSPSQPPPLAKLSVPPEAHDTSEQGADRQTDRYAGRWQTDEEDASFGLHEAQLPSFSHPHILETHD